MHIAQNFEQWHAARGKVMLTFKVKNQKVHCSSHLQLLGEWQLSPAQPTTSQIHVRWIWTPKNTYYVSTFRDIFYRKAWKCFFSDIAFVANAVPGVTLLPIQWCTDCIACRDSVAVFYQILRENWAWSGDVGKLLLCLVDCGGQQGLCLLQLALQGLDMLVLNRHFSPHLWKVMFTIRICIDQL